ncbi:MAG: DUF3298 domain-containing protein [Schwartzia sp.]|nr:DUF3298 domain-containing protein [Schwartzia sp. (in: firmicutes)]
MKKLRITALTAMAAFTLGAGLPVQSLPPVVAPVSVCEAASHIDESIRPIQLAVNNHRMLDADEQGMLLRSSETMVVFTGSAVAEGVEELQKALWAYNKENAEQRVKFRAKLVEQAKADRAERQAAGATTFSAYQDMNDVFIRRADTMAVSLLEYSVNYEGGVHGMSGVRGRNFDSKTGQELVLSDVCPDLPKLAEVIRAQLCREYPNASFVANGAETVNLLMGAGNIAWTLDPTGVSFYFNPYLIGSYSEGIFSTTVLFDEHPELFVETYCRAPKAYCMELRPYIPARASFANGDSAQVRVFSSDGGQRISLNGVVLDDWGETYDQRPVLVSLADGRRYLYVDGIGAGDAWERTTIYDVNGNQPVLVPMQQQFTRRADVDEDFAEAERGPIMIDEKRDKGFAVMADPEDFYMTRLNAATGKAELCQCRVGADGTPEVLWVQGQS